MQFGCDVQKPVMKDAVVHGIDDLWLPCTIVVVDSCPQIETRVGRLRCACRMILKRSISNVVVCNDGPTVVSLSRRPGVDDRHMAVHFVVFVSEDMAVPNVARACRRVDRELVGSRCASAGGYLLGSPAYDDACDLVARNLDAVFPSCLDGRGRGCRSDCKIGWIDGDGACSQMWEAIEQQPPVVVCGDVDRLALDDLELKQMDVLDVTQPYGAYQIPFFGRTDKWKVERWCRETDAIQRYRDCALGIDDRVHGLDAFG